MDNKWSFKNYGHGRLGKENDMSKVLAILVMCDSDDLGGIVSDFFKQFQNGKAIPEIKADYVKPLVVSDTMKTALKKVRTPNFQQKEKIIDFIRLKGEVGYGDIINADLGITAKSLAYNLQILAQNGDIERIGNDRPYRYRVASTEEES
jgi:hypothetical protein